MSNRGWNRLVQLSHLSLRDRQLTQARGSYAWAAVAAADASEVASSGEVDILHLLPSPRPRPTRGSKGVGKAKGAAPGPDATMYNSVARCRAAWTAPPSSSPLGATCLPESRGAEGRGAPGWQPASDQNLGLLGRAVFGPTAETA